MLLSELASCCCWLFTCSFPEATSQQQHKQRLRCLALLMLILLWSHRHTHTTTQTQTNTQSCFPALSCWPVLSRLYGPRGVYLIFPRLIARRAKSFSSLLVFLYARCTCSQKWARPESLSCPTPFLPHSLPLSLPLSFSSPFALSQNSLNKILHKVS